MSKSNRGFGIVGAIVTMVVLGFVTLSVLKFQSSTNATQRAMADKVLAQQYSNELLEFFRSLKVSELKSYLSQNRPTGGGYPLCTSVNSINRSNPVNPVLTSPDMLASLPTIVLNPGGGTQRIANRFYRVQVVNATSLEVKANLCGAPAAVYTLAPTEGYLVTVGISYFVPTPSGDFRLEKVGSSVLVNER